MGAIAFQKGLGVVHSMAHPLSSLLDTHHGLANAVNIPYGMRFNIAGNEDKFKRIARTLELKEESGEAVVKYLFEMNSKIKIPHKLRDIGVKQEHIETLSDLAIADFAHPNNPKPVSREDFRQLFDWYRAGTIAPHIGHRFDLEHAADAIRTVGERRAMGKVVITTDAPTSATAK